MITSPALRWCLVIVIIAVSSAPSFGKIHRSHQARAEFQRLTPCPATGKPSGKCPGYIVDHVKPLCAGGLDHHSNMQWQTVAEAKEKDKLERIECRSK